MRVKGLGMRKRSQEGMTQACSGRRWKGADGRAGQLRQLDGAHLGLIDGTAGAVGGEDGGAAGLDDVLEPQQSLARAARTGAAHGIEAEQLENARDQFAVEAAG
jgi:hypothetical protein